MSSSHDAEALRPGSGPRPLLSVAQFAGRHPAFSQAALRNLIFNARARQGSKGAIAGNGLDPALVRIGRRVLIDEQGFFAWLDGKQTQAV